MPLKSGTTDSVRHLAKKTKKLGDLAGTCALSQSPSKPSFNNPPVTSSSTARREAGQNPKASPSTTRSSAVSQHRDLITPTRVSSRVSRPTLKKQASFKKRPRSLESDGTPPLSIISPAPPLPPLSLKRKKPTNDPIKRLTGNKTPYKSKRHVPDPIELTSDDDDNQAQPPRKRVKHTPRKLLSSEVIDLCSESEDVISLPKRRRIRDKRPVVVVPSTDEEVDPEFPASSPLALRETDTREHPALPPSSPPIEDDSMFRASPSLQTHNVPVPIPNVPVAEESSAKDEGNTYTEKVDFPRGSLQTLYDEALARCVREPQHAKKIIDKSSPFSSLTCMPSTQNSTHSQSPTLHTPLFFNRIIHRLRARLKLRKTLDAKSFSDHTNFVPMEASKLTDEREDTSDTVMELSAVDSEAPEVATIIVPPIDSQDGALSDTQAARISSSILVNDSDVNQTHVSKTSSPSANQESPLPLEVAMLADTPIPGSIQALEASANSRTATPERVNSSVSSPNMFCGGPFNLTNPNAVNYQIETPQEPETISFRRENCANQIATIEPSVLKAAQFLVQTLRRRYDASNISEPSLLPAMELNNTAKFSTAPESLSESPVRSTEHATTTNIPSLTISGNTSSDSKCLSESPMMSADHVIMRDIFPHAASGTGGVLSTSRSSETPTIILVEQASSLTCSSGDHENASSSVEYPFESPAMPTELATMPNLSSPASPSGANTLSSGSRQSSDHSTSIVPVNCRLVTPEDSPSPLTPPVKAQKQEPFIRSNPSPPIVASFFDMDLSELGLRTLMSNSKYSEDDDDDGDSVSGMELVYPEEIM